jgi:hypothetical protein
MKQHMINCIVVKKNELFDLPICHNTLNLQVPYHLRNLWTAPHVALVGIVTKGEGAWQVALNKTDKETIFFLRTYH